MLEVPLRCSVAPDRGCGAAAGQRAVRQAELDRRGKEGEPERLQIGDSGYPAWNNGRLN